MKLPGAVTNVTHADVFDVDLLKSTTLHMNVKANSKVANLVPYALQKLRELDTDKVVWWGSRDAMAKVVACVETFKRDWVTCQSDIEVPKDTRIQADSSESHDRMKLYQYTHAYYEEKTRIVPEAQLEYTAEEAAIGILLSKKPLPSNIIDYQEVTTGVAKDLPFNMSNAPLTQTKQPSRRRLEPLRKRKRDRSGRLKKGVTTTEASTEDSASCAARFVPAKNAVQHALRNLQEKMDSALVEKKWHPPGDDS